MCETHSVVKAEVFVLYYIQKDIYTLLTFDSLQLSATKNLLNIRDLSVYKTRNMLYIIPYTLVCIICNVCNNNKYKNLNIIINDLHGQALSRKIQFSNTSAFCAELSVWFVCHGHHFLEDLIKKDL